MPLVWWAETFSSLMSRNHCLLSFLFLLCVWFLLSVSLLYCVTCFPYSSSMSRKHFILFYFSDSSFLHLVLTEKTLALLRYRYIFSCLKFEEQKYSLVWWSGEASPLYLFSSSLVFASGFDCKCPCLRHAFSCLLFDKQKHSPVWWAVNIASYSFFCFFFYASSFDNCWDTSFHAWGETFSFFHLFPLFLLLITRKYLLSLSCSVPSLLCS